MTLRRHALPLVLLCLSAPAAPGRAGEGRPARFETADGVQLNGSFHAGTRRSPCVLLLHDVGSAHSSKDYRRLAEHLDDKGYAVLAFDFRGHGRSRGVDPSQFWSNAYANRNHVRGAPSEEVSVRDFSKAYYPVLVNDIAAAKAYLDRKNDAGECNSSNLIVIGAGEGATLGALWMNAEFHRHRTLPAQFIGAAPNVDPNPEGQNLLAAVWLSISPDLGGRKVSLTTLLDAAGRQKKVPMVFMHAADNARNRNIARALERALKAGQTLPYTAAVPVPGVGKASGEDLVGHSEALKAVTDYLDAVKEASAREWVEHDARQALYLWRSPLGGLQAANTMGSNTPNYKTYVEYLTYR